MPPARIALAELAPITQRSASRRFDLPQPLGPTIPVRPGSMRNSVGSTKDLKPERRSRWKCTGLPAGRLFRRRLGGADRTAQGGQGLLALHGLAVDDERGSGVDVVA